LRTVTFEEFRALALQHSPLVAEIDSQYAQEVSRAYDTEVLRNPEVQVEQVYTRMKLGGADDPQTNASLSLPLRLSNFGAKARVAALVRKAGDTERQAKLLELSQKVLVQYSQLYTLQRSLQFIELAERRAGRHITQIKEGVAAGLLSDGDRHIFEAEKYRLESQRAGVQASLAALHAEHSMSLGISCSLKTLKPSAWSELPSEDALISKATASTLSEAARVELLMALSTEQKKLASLDAFPEVSPRIVYQHTNDGGDFIGAGISIPLPVFNRNQGAINKASFEAAAALRKREILSNGGLEARIRALRIAAASSAEQARVMHSKVVPAFEKALASEEQRYREGKANVLEVWQTFRIFNDAQREAIAVWQTALNTRVQLSLIVGEEL
jgi:cobalt-zinc-cadmium efflux system outer membrane protein